MSKTKRIFVEKKPGFRVEADSLRNEFNENLSLSIQELRLLNVYDLDGFSDDLLEKCRYTVFGEKVTDSVTDSFPLEGHPYLAVEYIPGQFDQRAASAIDCVHLIDPDASVRVKSARLLVFDESVTPETLQAVRHYFINAVESREKDLNIISFSEQADVAPVPVLEGFIDMEESDLQPFCSRWGLAMNHDDLREVVHYFQKEGRNPTETELRILDTYWSDHCRHTTFTTRLESIGVEDSFIREDIESTLDEFHRIRVELGRGDRTPCLMELATIGARYLRHKGLLDDMEVSEENNACSIYIDVDVDGKTERWLLMFKNETHNHPTEIEPFGGAATCLGGAIRDPLSGRSYVYQALRVTGAGDILQKVSDTRSGKLPQKVISRKAAAGYSSYGNQIGLATTHVREIHHPGYVAKRLEVGAVVGAVKASSVRRESPAPGDVILLLGGRTGRDGIGGATGSSKEHTEASLETCGSEVQKGNAPEERKLQRLFRREDVTRLIKKSNDFGAGGVSVAIGELAPGLDIHLERVPVKYSGLNPTELAISESQERMAVVIAPEDVEAFCALCGSENVEVTRVAEVTGTGRMRLFYGDRTVADLSREFIDSAGAPHHSSAIIAPVEKKDPFQLHPEGNTLQEKFISVMASPNVASEAGLIEMFDSTIGRSTVLMPFGGRTQRTESQVSVQKLPVQGKTDTASMMAFGFDPDLSSWSPYHGAAYAVIDACTKVAAAGGEWSGMRFSYQEYFERMTADPHSWGKPLSALLGALKMQLALGLPSIGGKDSMSGTFEDISVPPTLIAFGIRAVRASEVISPEFKKAGNRIALYRHTPLENGMPDTDLLRNNWEKVRNQILAGKVVSAWAVGVGGVAEALVKMALGNNLGFDVHIAEEDLFRRGYGSIVVESTCPLEDGAEDIGTVDNEISVNGLSLDKEAIFSAWEGLYEKVYPSSAEPSSRELLPSGTVLPEASKSKTYPGDPIEHPLVYIPVFPGTNCDYDTAAAFKEAGARVKMGVFRNLTGEDVINSINEMAGEIASCQILALAGGFSEGDEPDGSGKFIANVLNNSKIADEIHKLLERGGLILGICNGFQALVKSGLLPYGRLGSVPKDAPTLFRNDINRHVSRIAVTSSCATSSPWLAGIPVGTRHLVAVSHGEGKFTVSEEMARRLFASGQVAFRYADADGNPTMDSPWNPNGSSYAIEGIVSPDGQILGKMGHSERFQKDLFKNLGEDESSFRQPLFENAVNYFRKKI